MTKRERDRRKTFSKARKMHLISDTMELKDLHGVELRRATLAIKKREAELKEVQTMARRANARLRALEASPEGFEDTSSAYALVKDVFRNRNLNSEYQLVTGGYDNVDKLQFRTDVKTINATDPYAVEVLKQELNIFLGAEDSTPQKIREMARKKQQIYEQSVSKWQSEHNVSREEAIFQLAGIEDINRTTIDARTQSAFESFNKNRGNKYQLTREQYDFLFSNAYTKYLSEQYSSSDEWVDIAIEAIFEHGTTDLVLDYLNKAPKNVQLNLGRTLNYIETGTQEHRFERIPEEFRL